MALQIQLLKGGTWFSDAKTKEALNAFPNAKAAVEFVDDSCNTLVAKNMVLTIGRQKENTIVLDDNDVSRYGCILQGEVSGWIRKSEKWFVKDTGARIKIIVWRNKRPIDVPVDDGVSKGVSLQDGDELLIGTTVLKIILK